MATQEMTLQAKIDKLEAENAALKAANNRPLTLKVSEKGGVSLYGLGRWPTTLYREQWAKVLDHGPAIRAFCEDHDAELTAIAAEKAAALMVEVEAK